jgi:hypothetical protein
MTKISQYSTDVNITGNDKWIGSDAQNFLITKNFTPNNLASFFNENNVIDIGTSIRYRYQTLLPGEAREQGTISFETEIGPQVNFSAITTFLIAKNTLKGNTVTQYLDFLVDGKVLLSKASNINIFGYYKITSIEPWIPNTNFFVVEVDFLAGNGFISEDLDYLVSLVDKVQDIPPPVWGSITGDIEDQTDLIDYISSQIITPTLAEVLAEGNETGGENIVINDADAIQLENASTLKKGTYDFGADGGISRICGVGFEDMWQSGIRHVFDSNGLIRNSTNCFDIIPDETFDDTLRFKVHSLWTLDNGDTYKCTDASTGAAVWELVNTGTTPSLAEVLLQGGRELVLYSETDTHILENADKSRLLYCRKNTEDYVAIQFGIQGGVFEAGDTIEFISSNIDIFELNVDVDFSGVVLIYQGEEYSGGNILQFEDKGIKLILTCIDTNTFELNIIPSYDAIFDRSAINVASSFTAVNSRYYTTYGATAITVTDPTPENGKGYIVYVINGSTTIGGVGYTTGDLVYRYYNGTSWVSTNMNAISGVTSVGLTMPSAFTVTNSPITSSGVIAVTGAGLVSQYVRGDGTLANFPASTGGGASVSFYLNGSVSQGTISGIAFKEMDRTPILGAGTDFTINANGYIQSFITDANVPNQLEIPAGNWNFETYFSASSGGGSPSFYIELYKWNGTTLSLIASNSATPRLITDGTNIEAYFSALAVPQTTLLATDRLAIRIYVTHSGRTITLHTENSHLCQVITTFTTGLTALNGLTNQVQYFDVGTGATNFNISSSGDTHTFNLLFNIRRNANNSSNNNINYNGYAVTGSAESSAVWTITRLTIAASGSITVATATNVAWTDRETTIYT